VDIVAAVAIAHDANNMPATSKGRFMGAAVRARLYDLPVMFHHEFLKSLLTRDA
jgi:hypothetical protein